MTDIETRSDIELLVHEFYRRVREDETVGIIFNNILSVDWDKHLPLMCDFWDNILFFSGKNAGNPMELHKQLHGIRPIGVRQFERWLQLFTETVDDLFRGEKASLAKHRARSISSIIENKIILQKK